MSKRKQHGKDLPPWLTSGASSETFFVCTDSLLKSPAFQDLSNKQKVLYVTCLSQMYGKRKPCRDYPDVKEFQRPEVFYFNKAIAVSYGLYSDKDTSLYKDMNVLISHGFIEKLLDGKVTYKKNVYCFSAKWKTWGKNKNGVG